MIKGTATGRCKCGVTVKVITETDRAKIADVKPVIAACPKCGDKQAVYAHRIISVTTENGSRVRS
jgi:DNA-directed RNA polymerase subunit M/transcription elongation factor TFIIS